jgi:hypothetical protein
MRKMLAAGLAVLTLTGCTAEQKAISEAKDLVRTAARDPDSIEFRNMRQAPKSGAVCGEVNGRNGFGGKTGWTPILVRDGRVDIAESPIEEEDPNVAGFWDRFLCACYTEEERVARALNVMPLTCSP